MGKIVLSWSTVPGQGGTTANIVALSSLFALEQPYRTLITQTQHEYMNLESLFLKEQRANGFDDGGMAALERLVKSKMLKPEAVSDYTDTIFKNRLDLLVGNPQSNVSSEEKEHFLRTVMQVAKHHYDILWIDNHSGIERPATRTLLNDADLVVVNLPQNRYILERFFSGQDFPEELQNKPYIVLIGLYDEKGAFSLRNIKRKFKVKAPIFGIPYVTGYRDASNQQEVAQYFHRHLQVKQGEESYSLISSLQKVNTNIAKQLGLLTEEDEL
ncbi:hypothetical protein [Bacillus sp. UMB0728]|uniref:hypothetical protein n=1 Tax=Bacillus sp. UMB0728 TaxID=2066052 RepID=UPI000C7775F4|nr:hypothetical protein [Bacillus sp. UMB0728]PLR70522.1 hypothetical protein CYJ37_23600 [Bacillus sp. UMB0728]